METPEKPKLHAVPKQLLLDAAGKPIHPPPNHVFSLGDLVFFKQMQSAPAGRCSRGVFQGFGYGVYLGHLPPQMTFKDAPNDIKCLMGQAGYISWDDCVEFLDGKQTDELFKKFKEKYYVEEMKAQREKQVTLNTDAPENTPA